MRFKISILLIFIAFAVISCKKSGNQPDVKKEVDIYVSGATIYNGKSSTAAYWKNGKITVLSSNEEAQSIASSIALDGTDVYVTGLRDINGLTQACFWKNGVRHSLEGTDQFSQAKTLVIKDKDIYIVGQLYNTNSKTTNAVCWKNGIKTNLVTTDNSYSDATGIAINGNDIYISGVATINGFGRAVVWKNGVMTTLPYLSNPPPAKQYNEANGITVVGNDVYVVGNEYPPESVTPDNQYGFTALYWKNGVGVKIESAAVVGNITINKNNIYVGGRQQKGSTFDAIVWNNGKSTTVYTGDYNTAVGSLAINQDDIYTTGSCGSCQVGYWKNGTPQKFSEPVLSTQILVVDR